MIRFLLNVVSHLVSSILALLIAGWILSQWVTLHVGGFLVAVALVRPSREILAHFVFHIARQYAYALLGGIGPRCGSRPSSPAASRSSASAGCSPRS